jgi:hypothetical protein
MIKTPERFALELASLGYLNRKHKTKDVRLRFRWLR